MLSLNSRWSRLVTQALTGCQGGQRIAHAVDQGVTLHMLVVLSFIDLTVPQPETVPVHPSAQPRSERLPHKLIMDSNPATLK